MPEIIDIRQFDAGQLMPMLQAESSVWGAQLHWDYSASVRLISSCLDEKRLSGYALVRDRQIEGYSFFFYEGEKGLIGNLFVEPAESRVDQALRLLEHVIETVTEIPGISRVETQLPHFDFEDLAPCFAAHGFHGYKRNFMVVQIAERYGRDGDPGRPTALPSADFFPLSEFVIEPWDPRHDRAAAQLLHHVYRDHVDAVINDQYSSESGATRLIDNILHQRGCGEQIPRGPRVAIHRPTGKLAAVLALTSVRPVTAHIPQIAVEREFQACGVGTAMMDAAFRDLARRGFQEVSLTVTESNSGAVRLYQRMGFVTFRTFGAFVWNRQ